MFGMQGTGTSFVDNLVLMKLISSCIAAARARTWMRKDYSCRKAK